MRRELEAVQKALDKNDVRKRKYLSLYEEDAIDRGELVARIEELKAERASLERRKAEIEGELRLCSDEPVPYDVVRQALGQRCVGGGVGGEVDGGVETR